LSVADFVSTDKDVRRTEEFAYGATQSERSHGSNTIETLISIASTAIVSATSDQISRTGNYESREEDGLGLR